MKICFIAYDIFNLGGIQRVTSVIANELSNNNIVDIICTNENSTIDREIYSLSKNINVDINSDLNKKNIFEKIFFKILKEINKNTGIFNRNKFLKIMKQIYYPKKIQNKFINYINNNEYDIVIGVAGEYSLLLGIINNQIKAKTIGWQHNSFEAYFKSKKRYFWNQDKLFSKYIPRLNKYIVLTEHDKNMLSKSMTIDSSVIYNPRSFSSKNKSKLAKKNFLAAGRFNYQKGFDLLIEAFLVFSKDNKDWTLTIVGEGEERESIIKMIKKYNLHDRIKINNFTKNIENYFLNASALLLSSRWEGMPMIVLESLEMGVPIISFDITAISTLVTNNEQGIIVQKNDIIGFANAMKEISSSFELRKEMSKKAMEKSKQFNIEEIAEKWNTIIYKIASNEEISIEDRVI